MLERLKNYLRISMDLECPSHLALLFISGKKKGNNC